MNSLQKNILFALLTRRENSRKDLSSLLGVTRAAITQNTNILLEDNIICRMEKKDRGGAGRREEIIEINPQAFCTYGLDIEEDKINMVRLDAASGVTDERSFCSVSETVNYFNGCSDSVLSVAISQKGFYSRELLGKDEKELYDFLSGKYHDVYFLNNIAALAYCYKFYHPADTNFILIKYGPGLGSACFIDNRLLEHKTTPTYEIGKMIYNTKGDIVEDIVKYDSFAKGKDAVKIIMEDSCVKEKILSYLALCIININTCLQLDKIVISGDIFRSDDIFENLLFTIKKINPAFNESKLVRIENYSYYSEIKSGIAAKYLVLNK